MSGPSPEVRGIADLLRGDGRLLPYLTSAVVGAVLRAAAILAMVPLLRSLFAPATAPAWPWLLAFALLVAAGWWADATTALRGFRIGLRLLGEVDMALLARLQRLPIGWFSAPRKTEVQQLFAQAGQEAAQGMNHLGGPTLHALLTPLLLAAGLFLFDPPLAWVALAATPVLVAALLITAALGRRAERGYADAAKEVSGRTVEFAQAQPLLRASRRAAGEASFVEAALRRQRRATVGLLAWSTPAQLLFALLSQAALLTLLATVVHGAVLGRLPAATAVALLVAVIRFLEPFQQLAQLAGAWTHAGTTLGRLGAVLGAAAPASPSNEAPSGQAAARAQSQEPIDHHPSAEADSDAIVLDGVDFAYDGAATPVLRGLSFRVPRGHTVAVVGPSGSGKSTVLALVAGALQPLGGSVRLFGRDVVAMEQEELAALLAVVFQDVYLFGGSLRENVLLGRPEAEEDELQAAAKAAQLEEMLARLPHGWHSQVGEGGANLSGGERQRASVARALLKQAPLLLLDEATSSLDALNEGALVKALQAGRGRRTTVVVAHRLETIAQADRILFLEQGRIVERGSLAELLQADGRFAAYWRQRQQAGGWTLGRETVGQEGSGKASSERESPTEAGLRA